MSERFDVVVVGSGAGGLSAAVAAAHGGARVLVVEKSATCGGATAWSGGWMWTPRHRFAREAGVVIPLGAVVAQLMASAVANGDGGLDHSALLRGVLRLSGQNPDSPSS